MSDPITRLNAALEGRYAIDRELGEGGMATVYLADDVRHERKVALKVLKPELAAVVGAERFLAEIKTTANLQHPHILPLHDSGEADGFLYYVMPYIEGESLRERLQREKQLPVDEAVRIATDVAEALHSAHKQGVIHRDVKPANILLSEGRPLVADFGIALAVSAAGGGRLTETGLSMGTPYYMSPEQASADREPMAASDVYSLGCVLYEMLVGEPPYAGGTAQAVLAKILTEEARAPTQARPSIPANVDAAIRKALEKLPADRFADTNDFARALGDVAFRHGDLVGVGVAADAPRWNRLAISGWSVAAVLGLALGWAFVPGDPEPSGPVARFQSLFPPGQAPSPEHFTGRAFNVSPDGSMLVYRGPADETSGQLWLRRWAELEGAPIRGTEGGFEPAISADGRELAFSSYGEVQVLSFEGGPIRTVAEGRWPRWGPDGFLYFLTPELSASRVRSTGGTVEPVTSLAEREVASLVADFLPGGEVALLGVNLEGGDGEIRLLELATGEVVTLTSGSWPRYVYSGHLTFLTREGALMAARFDLEAMELTGPPVAVLDGVGQYAVSDAGDLVYTTTLADQNAELVWVTRAGAVSPIGWRFSEGGSSYTWRLSPDGSRVALRHRTDDNYDIWVKELPDGPPLRITVAPGAQQFPWWSPDGGAVTYLSDGDVWSIAADGTGEPTLLLDGERSFRAGEWSPDGAWLVLRTTAAVVGASDQPDRDVLGFRPGVDTTVIPLVATQEFAENGPAISRDGRWLAYSSNETGSFEVWVRPFPDVNANRYRVSDRGGYAPRWAHSGRELFYMTLGGELVAAEINTSSGFSVVGREVLFALPSDILTTSAADPYDVAPDDQRFVMARTYSGDGPGLGYILVQNFDEELRRLVPDR